MKPKVLLVDDIDFFLEMEKDLLSNANVEILTAKNGQQALEIALRERPRLIFMDVIMPVMDGLTCCRLIKNDSRLRDIPVIIVFAGSKEITPESCMKAGCDGTLGKPIDREKFLDLGRKFLEQVERREPRVPCRAQVIIRRNGREVVAACEDLSESGMYICCPEEVARNEMIRLHAQFSGGIASGELMAKITWLNQGEKRKNASLPDGFGVKFTNPSPSAKMIIQDMVRRLSAANRRQTAPEGRVLGPR